VQIHASILAQACNFGLTTTADVAELSYRQLTWYTNWYLREEIRSDANPYDPMWELYFVREKMYR
jgi:hypothetical protein